MTSLKSSANTVSAKTADASARTVAKRPWYSWLCAASAALVGLYYLYYLTITPVTNGLAFVWLAAIVACCFGGAVGFTLNRKWGAQVFLVACLLLLVRVAFNAYGVYAIATASYSSGFAIRFMTVLIILVLSAYSTALAWCALVTMWRHSQRLAWATLLLLITPLLLGLAIIPTAFLKP